MQQQNETQQNLKTQLNEGLRHLQLANERLGGEPKEGTPRIDIQEIRKQVWSDGMAIRIDNN